MPDPREPRQLIDSDFVCRKHVGTDLFLADTVRAFVKGDPEASDKCAFCKRQGMPVDELVRIVAAGVNKFFDRANDAGVPFDEGDWVFPVMSTEEVLADLGIDDDSPLLHATVGFLEDDAWVSDGDGWPDEQRLLRDAWDGFSEHIKHRSRFLFDVLPTQDAFGGVDSLGTRDFLRTLLDAIILAQPILELKTRHAVYRARSFAELSDCPPSVSDYTSPPSDKAAQGRMNPAGIAYFYGALEPETAAVEVYDGNAYAGVATFKPARTLRLIDLSKARVPSPFDDSVALADHRRRLFLHGFTNDIARPIVRDGRIHQEYVPTQAVTEYIRFRARPKFDGVVFASARTDGRNVVIFADQGQCLGTGQEAMLAPTTSLQVVEYGAPSVSQLPARKLQGG